ncbi:restriction endonuclease-like protein [Neobacillus sp. YIM B06451]|uniref:restriction endonuclease-like protein n=1 Tax=Neobacillus sp. YIM B06451 TaxID=3070994 RepID=UPI00292CC3A6|nr:restriction endonuclease-like protein [Neobacillus sp. YIM B06451]
MVSLPSGSREDVELVRIETDYLSLIIKGKPYHERYEGLMQYRSMDFHDIMQFIATGEGLNEIKVYNINAQKLDDPANLRPIFFENGIYQLIVLPKSGEDLTFFHEHQGIRQAISPVTIGNQKMLMGNLQFQSEVGFTTFEIRSAKKTILSVTMEIFPTKLDYKNDYQKLLNEVNEEIYNLAFHFIRKTYLGAKLKLDGEPSKVEFFRLISHHFDQFLQAITQIERQPHHKLVPIHEKARGDQLRKLDSTGRNYLRKRARLFIEVNNGIPIMNKQFMPTSGLNVKKEMTFDTFENRYVKWMMERLVNRLAGLLDSIRNNKWMQQEADIETISGIENMISLLRYRLRKIFWTNIGKIDRPMLSLVLQMAPGYRDTFQIYLTVSKGLMLHGNIYRMSLKDVATLYEYWTYLKLGQILGHSYTLVSQNVVSVNRNGLYVNLDANKTAKRVYKHPITNEEIILTYQKRESGLPTVSQVPDTVLSIEKKGKYYKFNYIFDAKYRIDYAQEGSYYFRRYDIPGPLEDDINTMHRYRDSIVAVNDGPYERTAFGAYVLFPWHDEVAYQQHYFYKSINKVNIGGLPFLPNATTLVEQFIERLIDKSPEEIQQEGILPIGTVEEWRSKLDDIVLVGLVSTRKDYEQFIREGHYLLPAEKLNKGWQEAKHVALYVKAGLMAENGVLAYGTISTVKPVTINSKDFMQFKVSQWKDLNPIIKPVHYGISNYILTSLNTLKESTELPELFMKSKEETTIWRMLRRVSDQIKLDLDHNELDRATHIREYRIKDIQVKMNIKEREIVFEKNGEETLISVDELERNPSGGFRVLVRLLA